MKGPPDLVIEVLSPSTRRRDRGLKKKRYGLLGVGEYWIVDGAQHVVEQHLSEAGALRLLGTRGDQIRPQVLPEVCIDLREVW